MNKHVSGGIPALMVMAGYPLSGKKGHLLPAGMHRTRQE
jgi:hypothetical protein